MSSLVKLVKRFYEENSRYEAGAPVQLIKQLSSGKLVLSDLEIGDEDISVLIRLFNTKKAAKEIKWVELNRSSGAKTSRRGTASSFSANGFKLLRELLIFVAKCENLEIITFDSIELSAGLMTLLGKALVACNSEVKWIAFKSCEIGGDEGVRAISPFLGKLPLQVLSFENCKLSDPSLIYIASIVKAQESNLDAFYWNATLRLDTTDYNRQQILEETEFVYSKGLVALSLWGNQIEGHAITDFIRVVKKNNWLLGLNLGNNKLSPQAIHIMVEEFQKNNVIQSVLLRENEGFSAEVAKDLYESILSKSVQKFEGMLAPKDRLNRLSPRVSWLLKSWIRLQCEETKEVIEQSLVQVSSRTSLNTLQRTISREHNLRELHRPYSVFAYLHDDEDEIEDHRNSLFRCTRDDPLILYDLEEEDHHHHPHELNGKASSQALTERYVIDSYQSSSRGGERGGEGFHHLEYSKRYDGNGFHDELELAIPSSSPKANGHRGQQQWEYWPDESQPFHGVNDRPPSRISIRPKRINGEFVPVGTTTANTATNPQSQSAQKATKKKKVPHYMLPKDAGTFGYRSLDQLTYIEERIRELSRSASPQRLSTRNGKPENGKMPWIPSSSNPTSPLASRRRPTPAVISQSLENLHQHQATKNGRRFTSPIDGINFKPDRKETLMKKRKKRSTKMDSALYGELSSSVLQATKNLEQISKHLKTVAESLSESALLNLTNDHIQQQSQLHQYQQQQQHSTLNVFDNPDDSRMISQPNTSYPPLQDEETQQLQQFTEELDLVSLVRERMHFKLKEILSSQLSNANP